MKSLKTNIRLLNLTQLEEWFIQSGDKKFRANQVYDWLWKKGVQSIEAMSNLSKETRNKLSESFEFPALQLNKTQLSADGTMKIRFITNDQHFIEGVIIPADDRITACVSSQIGCSLTCAFCATGKMKRERNLYFYEIFDQVAMLNRIAEKQYGRGLTNIVFMGMGEPLLNYSQVTEAIEKITSPDSLGMSPRRITVSTAGIAKMIRKLGDDQVRYRLALSLHAANDEKRSKIMPINDENNLESLITALNYFFQKTKSRISLEYILFKNVNDSMEDAKQLVRIARRIPCRVNIIEYNPVEGTGFEKASEENTQRFANALEQSGITVTIRHSRGKDIDAACGQLANKD
ncbi:MAG: 23S rRNA (adenine(2503)-C(2))-methyltransferase RlmN [Bacteroidetes bacterium]|nr:23S rRNA (adenine(2503)-C(2))-methyltransferase RlmN [Bacteroidota bacterium]